MGPGDDNFSALSRTNGGARGEPIEGGMAVSSHPRVATAGRTPRSSDCVFSNLIHGGFSRCVRGLNLCRGQ
jgi:hypothetical protein